MMKHVFIFVCLVITSCFWIEKDTKPQVPDFERVPAGFPKVAYPDNNLPTADRWLLGKKLFYDPILSVDGSISCASCHQQQLAFSDDRSVSLGVADRPGTRNAPSLANVAYHPYFMREGAVPTLEMQILVPIQEHNEFDFNVLRIADLLRQDASYVELAQKAYGREPDAFVITRAIANFERTLLSGNSRYDQYLADNTSNVLNEAEKRGMELFFSERTQCASCHAGFNFTNYSFQNNGLYEQYPDSGRFRLTRKETDRDKFKVPGLRNVEVTSPYMHDGSLTSLEEVLDHYNRGGHDHRNKSLLIKPLGLSEQEKADLIVFLGTLTDHDFLENPLYQDEN
jgi:cytochrome c peroxidase